MKLQNTSIGTRLSLGFSIILLFLIILGAVAYLQTQKLWQITDDLYNHPMQVSNATRDIKADITDMRLNLKSIAQDENLSQQELQQSISEINSHEAEVYKSFEIAYSRYLGPRADIDNAYNAFKNWKQLRDGVIKLRLDGDRITAAHAFKIDNAEFRNMMFDKIQVMIDFAANKADSFFKAGEKEKEKLVFGLKVVLAGISIFSILIVYILYKSIQTPLLALTQVANLYRQGHYNSRSNYVSTNEIGILASAFNNMAVSVQAEIKMNERSATIAQQLIKENELRPFCKELLKALGESTNSQVATIYFLNEDKTRFELFESIGMLAENCKSFSVNNTEGEFGAVLTQKKIVRIADIPNDTVFIFPAVTGQFVPRDLVSMPVLQDNAVVAIISLASIYDFTSESLQLLNEIQLMITARLHGVMSFQTITDISKTLDQQNRDLGEKSRELAMQADELTEYNIELKMQKKQVDEANRFKSAFLSNMSHELRTPLNSVIALSGVLTRKLKDQVSDDEFNYLGIIEKNGKQLLTLINDILDLSRIESGKEEINISRFNIYGLIESIVESIEPIATGKELRIVNTIAHNLPEIESDSTKCYHILQNVISNAVKFTEEGLVEISAKQENNEIHISVRDTGIGIEHEYIPLVFDEFRQADERVARKFGGTGLGLAIAKKYLLLLGGSIEVQSKPGIGSTFTIRLPLLLAGFRDIKNDFEPVMNPAQNTAGSSQNSSSENGKNILLVEDSEPQIIQMRYILEKNGYVVLIARNGKEALESIKISIPDAMILDLMMPEVDGFQVLDSIRSQPETSQIPVLILTAKHVTKNELFFLKGNHIHQIIIKGVVNRTELMAHVHNMMNPPKKEAVEPVKRKDSNGGKPIILVVEDNHDNLETVKALLSEKNEITGATDSVEGLSKARELVPDLILLDISLPGMDGFAVFDELRKDERLRHIPVVALTARAMKGDREELLAYGFDGYISKPIDSEFMEETIEKLMGLGARVVNSE